MSDTLTSYGRQLLLQSAFMPEVYTPPTGIWVAYCRAVPTSNTDGTELDEATTGYARAPIGALSSANWDWSGFAEVYNVNQVFFPTATADWGLIIGYALVDTADPETGNVIAVGEIIEPFVVVNGDAPFIDVGGIAIGLYD